MKIWKLIITAWLSLFIATNISAALIDNDTYSTDTASGLDWLDLSSSTFMTYSSALSNNPGWRYATKAEVANLFETIYAGYYDTSIYGWSHSDEGAYANQRTDAEYFKSLLGPTLEYPSYSYTYGLYSNEYGNLLLMGTRIEESFTLVYGMNNSTRLYDDFRNSSRSNNIGTFLVRSTVVPLPGAIWLFSSGLFLLFSLHNKNT